MMEEQLDSIQVGQPSDQFPVEDNGAFSTFRCAWPYKLWDTFSKAVFITTAILTEKFGKGD